MVSLIRGTTVTLFEKTETGKDAFGAAVYSENPVEVANVLISPVSSEDLSGDNQLRGRKEICELSIPKKNTSAWENCRVEFRGQKWRTFGFVQQLMTENTPLEWDRKVRAERYG